VSEEIFAIFRDFHRINPSFYDSYLKNIGCEFAAKMRRKCGQFQRVCGEKKKNGPNPEGFGPFSFFH
jgi:hypothetical protein